MSTDTSQPPVWALLLKKAPERAKSRLSGCLNKAERKALVEKMFRHVLHQALTHDRIDRVAVVSPDRPALAEGVLWIEDTSAQLNQAVSLGTDKVLELGAAQILILPCDLPWLEAGDISALVGAGEDYDMVIAPDDAGDGTNALLLRTPAGFIPAFGKGSFSRHLGWAGKTNRTVAVIERPGLGFDLDDEQDWQRYSAGNSSHHCELL